MLNQKQRVKFKSQVTDIKPSEESKKLVGNTKAFLKLLKKATQTPAFDKKTR